jgi:pimeloyl-ACP methyl ester carboxylesterase
MTAPDPHRAETAGQPQLYYRTLDQAPQADHPRIAFLHGLFGQGRNWTTIGRRLSDRYAVTLIDLPNHGHSAWTSQMDYPQQADQVAALLADLGDDWTVVGHSMGGKIAMALALRHRRLVQRLCVVDIAPVDYPGQREFSGYVRAMRSLDLDTLPSREAADQQLRPAVPSPTVRAFLLQNLRRDGDHWRWQMNLATIGDRLETLGHWPQPDTEPYPGPTLWIAGAESDYIRREYEPAMRALFPHLRTARVKGAGHWVHSEQPETFLQVLRTNLP